jgi:protein Mpv17
MKAVFKASIISGCVMGVGDAICQTITGNGSPIKWDQIGRFALVGATLHGPYFLYGFRLIDKVPLVGVRTALGRSVTKTLVTQVTIFPVYIGLMYVYLSLLEGLDRDRIEEKLLTAWPYTYAVGCAFWPAANVVNFLYVAPTMRAPYVAAMGTAWNTFLSWENTRVNKQL